MTRPSTGHYAAPIFSYTEHETSSLTQQMVYLESSVVLTRGPREAVKRLNLGDLGQQHPISAYLY